MPIAQVGDIAMYYEIRGAGDPLLLIGGLGADVGLHKDLIAGLASRHRVVAFDNRGAGATAKPDAPYSIAMMAHDALGLMDAVGVARADLLGISMGGRIALEIAATHRQRVRKLVLVSTSAAGTGRLRMSVPMRALGLLAHLPGLRRRDAQPDYAHQRQREATLTYDGSSRLSAVTAPTLIAHGRRDRTIPLARAEQLHAGIAGSQLRVFKGGHMFCFFAQRQKFLTAVDEFLGDGQPTASS